MTITSTGDLDEGHIHSLNKIINDFIEERLNNKLKALSEDDHERRDKLIAEHQKASWLADAARRVSQLKLATNTTKQIHPEARGTNVYLRESFHSNDALVGTHILDEGRVEDVVGNAAALDVYKFLKLVYDGRTVLQRIIDKDKALMAALSDDPELAQSWLDSFATIIESKGNLASHTLAKQVYFPLPSGGYHLLAPLFPTTLVHKLHGILQADRFSEAAQAARVARREKRAWHEGYREYPNVVVQKFGGSKPQNISQLNSERGGNNHLLPCLPPVWQSESIRPPLKNHSVFGKRGAFSGSREVVELISSLKKFLISARDWNNMAIRHARAGLVARIVDALVAFTARMHMLPPGWSAHPECQLHEAERRWLDPQRFIAMGEQGSIDTESDAMASDERGQSDWVEDVADRFARWLNAAVESEHTPMGDEEYASWKRLISSALDDIREELVHAA